MATRREFIKSGIALSIGSAVGSSAALAQSPAADDAVSSTATVFPGVLFSEENPGKWSGKAATHAPMITVEGDQVTVRTAHGMSAEHFIVRHTLVSANGETLGEKTFSPTDKEAVSVFEVPAGHSQLYATSFCNLHDLWLTEFSV